MNGWGDFSFQLKLASNLLLVWVMLFHSPFEFWFKSRVQTTFGLDYENKRFCMLESEKENTVSFHAQTHTPYSNGYHQVQNVSMLQLNLSFLSFFIF